MGEIFVTCIAKRNGFNLAHAISRRGIALVHSTSVAFVRNEEADLTIKNR
jgi:hypothetical protein